MALKAPQGYTVLSGPHIGPSTQDLEHRFGSAMPRPSCSDALGVPILCPVSVLPLAGLELHLVSPQNCQGLSVVLLLALALPVTLIPEVSITSSSPAPGSS